MATPERELSPCPECGSQRYLAKSQSLSINTYLPGLAEMRASRPDLIYAYQYVLRGTIGICGTCGYTTFYASNPLQDIEALEKDLGRLQELYQRTLQETAQRPDRKKKRFFGL